MLIPGLPLTHALASFWVVMLLICIMPLVATRLRLPALAGIIIGGALVGPSALNIITRDATITLLGNVGLLYLIFTAGLTIDMEQFFAQKYRSITFGLLSFFIPFVLAYQAGISLLEFTPMGAALLGSIIGTHTLVAYPSAQKLGLVRHGVVVMVVGGTILTDAFGLLVLAGVVRAADGSADLMGWLSFAAIVAVYLVLVLWGVPRLGRWFFKSFPNHGNVELAFVLAVLFGVALLSEAAGLAAIVGAFLTGLAMNRLIPSSGPFMSRILYFGEAMFVPFFLVSVGLLVDFREIFRSPSVILLALLFMALLCAGKLAAAVLAGLFFRLPWQSWMVAWGLSTPQAAATLAVTLVGYDQLQLFEATHVNAVVVLILISCLLGSWTVEHFGRTIAAQAAQDDVGDGRGRPQRIVVPLANPTTAPGLMSVALALRKEGSEDPIFPLAVAPDGDDSDAAVARAEQLLVHATQFATAAAVNAVPLTRVDFNVVDGVCRAIAEVRASSIIIGWNGVTSTRERVFGRVLDQVLERTTQMVLVCRMVDELRPSVTLRLAIPPLMEMTPGFAAAIRAAKLIAQRQRLKLVVYLHRRDRALLAKRLEKISPAVDLSWHEMESWNDVTDALTDDTEVGDLVVLMGAREHTLPWYWGFNRLPGRLASSIPSVNFLTLYPPMERLAGGEPTEAEISGHRDPSLDDDLVPALAGVAAGVPVWEPRDVLALLLGSALPPLQALTERQFEDLRDRLLGFNLELAPGVALLHAPLVGAETPVFLVATHKAQPGEGEDAPVAMLVLLNPSDIPPQRHLGNLARLARMAARTDLVKHLAAAENAEQVQQAFLTSAGPEAPKPAEASRS